MSPRNLVVIVSATLLAAACARANDKNFSEDEPDDDGSASSGNTSSSSSGNTSSSSTGPSTGSGDGTTTASTGGAGGMGGDGTTASSGGMGGAPATSGSGAGGNTNSCAHDTCTYGAALTIGCGDPCVDTVCATDDYCCDVVNGEWDDICIDEAVDLCGAQCTAGPLPGDLIITEIMNNPAVVNDSAGEWFEIHNTSSVAIDLDGLVVRHQGPTVDPNATVTINASVIVPAGGYAVLGNNGNSATNGGVAVDYVYSGVNLANTTDYLAIEDGLGSTIDEVQWSSTSGLNPNGKSRNLDPLFFSDLDNDDDTHFCEASSMMGGGDAGTPGQSNDACP